MSPRHKELIRHLCLDVRLVKADQAGRLMDLYGPGPADVRRELTALVSANFLRQARAVIRSLPEMTEPLARWNPGEAPPDCGALAWRLNRRWDVSPHAVVLYRAGPAARAMYGSGTCSSALNYAALSHDLACADMLLAFAARHPERLADWVSEDLRKDGLAHGEKLPDVILYDDATNPYLVCEVAGAYPKTRLEAFHAYASGTLGLPYELW